MRRFWLTALGLLGCLGGGFSEAAAAAVTQVDETWARVPIFSSPELQVRLRFRREASLAVEEWLALEFENLTDKPLPVERSSYRIESKREDLQTGQPAGSGGLGSGSQFALFPHAWPTTPGRSIALAPREIYRQAVHPSDRSSAILSSAGKDLRVRAQLFFNVELGGQSRFFGPADFDFAWRQLDEAGSRAALSRLRTLLAAPESRVTANDLFIALYNEVGQNIPTSELLAAFGANPESGIRSTLAGFVAGRGGEAAVAEWYRSRLSQLDDQKVLTDLSAVTPRPRKAGPSWAPTQGVWRPEFAELLIRRLEADPDAYRAHLVLQILDRHRDDWIRRPGVPARLSAKVRENFPWSTRAPADLADEDLHLWALEVGKLAITGDEQLIDQLRGALDDRRRHSDRSVFSGPPDYPPMRVCDTAAAAIVRILDGPAAAWRMLQGGPDAMTGATWAAGAVRVPADQVWDRQVAALKERLISRERPVQGGR